VGSGCEFVVLHIHCSCLDIMKISRCCGK